MMVSNYAKKQIQRRIRCDNLRALILSYDVVDGYGDDGLKRLAQYLLCGGHISEVVRLLNQYHPQWPRE